jgi:uncharacterized membrane protein YedE/YeeE
MSVTEFTPFASLAGGVLIGLAAVLLLAGAGRIAGISGIVDGLMERPSGETRWRWFFLAGLLGGTLLYGLVAGGLPKIALTPSVPVLVAGGLLVGIGTRLGGGCTSGHGICGLALFSPRSFVAVLVFMAAALVTVFVARHVVGS